MILGYNTFSVMRFLSPSAFWWLSLAAVIIFFYLLKLKRKRTVVPSVLLWTRALDEMEANAPLKKLRRNLLLLLQLLALIALVLALARPLVTTRALASGNTVVIIDSTASMSALDEDNGSRLDRAKQLAREMIQDLSGDDRAAIVESSSRVTVRAGLTSDRAALDAAIAQIEENDSPGNLTEAVKLAEQIAGSEGDAGVVVISDGGGSPAPYERESAGSRTTAVSNTVSVRFVRVGRRSENAGIIAMNSRPIGGGERREIFASIANFGAQPRVCNVELKVGGTLVDARTLELVANDRKGLVFESAPGNGALAELKLEIDDDLAADNVGYAFLPSAHRIRVGVVSENPFLLEGLAANSDLAVSKVNVSSISAEIECLVTDNVAVIDANRPMLAINPSDAAGFWRATGQRAQPQITTVERTHPINSMLNYSDLHIESMSIREPASWLKPLVSAGDDPVICAGDDGRRRLVMIGFDLAQSDLPLKIEFPILLANAISWLAGKDSPSIERTLRSGQVATIQTSATNTGITTPDGVRHEVSSRDGTILFGDTLRVGVYEVAGAESFAASLFSESESNTAPRESINTRAGETKGQLATFYSESEVWRWLALLGLAVLTIEWWVYHRRIA